MIPGYHFTIFALFYWTVCVPILLLLFQHFCKWNRNLSMMCTVHVYIIVYITHTYRYIQCTREEALILIRSILPLIRREEKPTLIAVSCILIDIRCTCTCSMGTCTLYIYMYLQCTCTTCMCIYTYIAHAAFAEYAHTCTCTCTVNIHVCMSTLRMCAA